MLVKMEASGGGSGSTAYMLYWYNSPTYFLTMIGTGTDVYARSGTNATTVPYEDDYIKITCTTFHVQTLKFKKSCTVVRNNSGDVSIHYNANDTYPLAASAYASLPLVVIFDQKIMSEPTRLGDITGFDDAEIIEIENDVCLVIDDDYDNTED